MSERWHRLAPGCRQTTLDGGSVIVEETGDDGRAEVRFVAPAGWRLERLTVDHRHRFEWLAERKSADGLVLACTPEGRWEAHIVECKRSIKDKTWAHVRAQLHGSRVRLDAVAGVVGLEVDRVFLYTAFRHDQIGAESPDPVLGVLPVGTAETTATAEGRVTWRAATLDVPDVGPLPHRRLQLVASEDDVGCAQVELGTP